MITEDYVSFKIAKLLKEKGFNEPCDNYYDKKGLEKQEPQELTWDEIMYSYDEFLKAPTHQMVMKWLREEHNLYIEIFVTWRDKIPHYQWRINNLITQDTIVDTPCLEKPEEAVESALKYLLENLI